MTKWSWLLGALVLNLPHLARAGGQSVVVNGTRLATTGLIVTQFAVPVAVPQYAVTVAPTSFVQYGGQSTAPSSSNGQSLEDRIVAKVLKGLQASGQFKPESAPSLIERACGTCHGETNPKAGFSMIGIGALTPEKRLQGIARALSDDPGTRMPPASSGIKLTAEELGKLLQELSQNSQEGKP